MIQLVLLGVLIGLAGHADCISRRIPNTLILAGLALGLACNGLVLPYVSGAWLPGNGGSGLLRSLLGALLGGGLLFPLWRLRVMGAGDVKLMAVVGSFLGPVQVFGAVILTAVAGGLLALGVAIATGSLRQVLGNLRLMLLCMAVGRDAGLSVSDIQTTGRLPYALAIAAGTLAQVLMCLYTDWPLT